MAIAGGFIWARRPDKAGTKLAREYEPRNPLELRAAFLFAFLFLLMITATQLAVAYLGRAGINTLAAIMGVTDVDPFILGITQTAGASTALKLGAEAILIAAASNNFVKGIYAYFVCRSQDGHSEPLPAGGPGSSRPGAAVLDLIIGAAPIRFPAGVSAMVERGGRVFSHMKLQQIKLL